VAHDWLAEAWELRQRGEPFAVATVVRCERPTSAKPGAKALIRADGSVVGWVGGSCAEPVTVKEALAALADGQPRLLVLVGEGGAALGRTEGVREYTMTCHSGGTLEIYVEPVLPKPELVVVGSGPVVETLARLAAATGYATRVVEESVGLAVTARAAIVVATHGRADEDALDHALRTEAEYVSLVASPKRARAIVEALAARGVPAARLQQLKAPAGLDLGAVTPEEIAVSILAEIVAVTRQRNPRPSAVLSRPAAQATRDPVCGMTVDVATARYRSERGDQPVYFCCAGCQRAFDLEPDRYR